MKNSELTLRTLRIGATSTLLAGCGGASPIAAGGRIAHDIPYPGFLEERVGFEPTKRSSRSAVFKTAAFNHSATSPSPANVDLMRVSAHGLANGQRRAEPFANIC